MHANMQPIITRVQVLQLVDKYRALTLLQINSLGLGLGAMPLAMLVIESVFHIMCKVISRCNGIIISEASTWAPWPSDQYNKYNKYNII